MLYIYIRDGLFVSILGLLEDFQRGLLEHIWAQKTSDHSNNIVNQVVLFKACVVAVNPWLRNIIYIFWKIKENLLRGLAFLFPLKKFLLYLFHILSSNLVMVPDHSLGIQYEIVLFFFCCWEDYHKLIFLTCRLDIIICITYLYISLVTTI